MTMRILFLGMILVASGCSSARTMSGDVSTQREFYALPTAVQLKTFRNRTLEDQLELYHYGSQVRHPPAIYLARCFALNGESAVELLRSKLASDNDDHAVRDVVTLLATIDSMSIYDVANDSQLMAALHARVAQVRDGGLRDSAERRVSKIGEVRSESPVQAPECG